MRTIFGAQPSGPQREQRRTSEGGRQVFQAGRAALWDMNMPGVPTCILVGVLITLLSLRLLLKVAGIA